MTPHLSPVNISMIENANVAFKYKSNLFFNVVLFYIDLIILPFIFRRSFYRSVFTEHELAENCAVFHAKSRSNRNRF